MTRLQNAKNQLSEALAALESAASQAVCQSAEANALASSSQIGTQAPVDADLSLLVDEVRIIEAKLSKAKKTKKASKAKKSAAKKSKAAKSKKDAKAKASNYVTAP